VDVDSGREQGCERTQRWIPLIPYVVGGVAILFKADGCLILRVVHSFLTHDYGTINLARKGRLEVSNLSNVHDGTTKEGF
jgi:hypothetical protein